MFNKILTIIVLLFYSVLSALSQEKSDIPSCYPLKFEENKPINHFCDGKEYFSFHAYSGATYLFNLNNKIYTYKLKSRNTFQGKNEGSKALYAFTNDTSSLFIYCEFLKYYHTYQFRIIDKKIVGYFLDRDKNPNCYMSTSCYINDNEAPSVIAIQNTTDLKCSDKYNKNIICAFGIKDDKIVEFPKQQVKCYNSNYNEELEKYKTGSLIKTPLIKLLEKYKLYFWHTDPMIIRQENDVITYNSVCSDDFSYLVVDDLANYIVYGDECGDCDTRAETKLFKNLNGDISLIGNNYYEMWNGGMGYRRALNFYKIENDSLLNVTPEVLTSVLSYDKGIMSSYLDISDSFFLEMESDFASPKGDLEIKFIFDTDKNILLKCKNENNKIDELKPKFKEQIDLLSRSLPTESQFFYFEKSSGTFKKVIKKIGVINDSDEYTNVRKGKSAKTEIEFVLTKGQKFNYWQNPNENWWYVESIIGSQEGFIHKSRIQEIKE